MAETQNNIPCLHRPEWQTMTPTLTNTAAGSFVINDNSNLNRFALYVVSATVHYLYDHQNDDWIQIESGALGGTFGAGACGAFTDWSPTYTVTGGSTTTITVNAAVHNIKGFVVGETVEFLSGTAANIGLRRVITAIKHPGTATGTITLTLDSAVTSAVANNDTIRISTGTFFVFMPGTLSATSFKKYDLTTGTWTACSVTGLPATWGTDGRMTTACMFNVSYDTGTATSGNTTSLTDTTKAWTADQWINYQVRITAGTGLGQIRVITDNTATSLTFASGATLDNTSEYAIQGDENSLYLLGNNAVTMYKYSISGNSWATISPTTARAGAPVAGMSADFVGKTGDAGWADITDIKDGRYIYSLRGTSAVIDRFNISGGTNGAGAWEVISYNPYLVTFAAGSSTDWAGNFLYISKEGSATVAQKTYRFNLIENNMKSLVTDYYLNGAAVLGSKMWIHYLSSNKVIFWLYQLGSTSNNLRRIMIF